MKNSILIIIALLLFTPEVQAQEYDKNSEKVKQIIQENFKQMKKAMAAEDAGELSMYFTEDALLKFPDQEPLTGRKAIEQAHQQMLERGLGIKPKSLEVFASGDMAFEIGTYEILDSKGQKIDRGHYATLWKKEADQWRISRDIISSTKIFNDK